MATEQATGGFAATTIVLRARQHWQALDLGFALVREHAGMLYGSWFVLTFPIAILLSVALPPFLALLIFWWLKPLYERLTLLYLSKAVFGERLAPSDLARVFLRTGRVQLAATLIWRRFSVTRSLDQPIALLEGARGAKRQARLKVLHRQLGTHAAALVTIMSVLETTLAVAGRAAVLLLVPGELDTTTLLKGFSDIQLGLWPYFIAVGIVGPAYAASGFSLYINRRCELEGWDIEVGFRRLAARLRGGAVLLCCLVGGLTVAGDGRAAAADSNARARADVADVSPKKLPEQAQLSDPQRDGTSAASRESRRLVDHVLAGAKFHRVEKQRLPVFLEDMDSETVARQSTPLPRWLRALIMNFVDVVWWSAWVVVIGIGAWLGYRYRYWIAELAGRPRRQRDREVARGAVIAGVSLGAAATADDSEAQAGALWMRGDQRAALAMLLRLSLVSLVRRHGCVFVHGDTETDCTRRVTAIQPFARADYFQRLIGVWQDVAYAHRLPAVQTFGELLAGYHDAMESLIAVPAAPARAAAAGMQ